MADTKISGLTALAAADVETDADVLAIVDDSATATKKITVDNLRTSMGPKLETEQATTSGTSVDFTSLPAWVKKITVMYNGVSTSGSSPLMVQVGDSGGVENTGYTTVTVTLGGTASVGSTAGFQLASAAAAGDAAHGTLYLTLQDASNNTWHATGLMARDTNVNGGHAVGFKSLSGALDRVRLTTVGGSDTFDAGAVNLLLE